MSTGKRTKMADSGAYASLITGLGTVDDKTESVYANPNIIQDDIELARMFVKDGLASRVASCVPEAAFKNDISIIGDTDGKTQKALYKIGLLDACTDAGIWTRLFGGAVIVTLYEGKTLFNQPPLDSEKVTGYKVFSSAAVDLNDSDFVKLPESKYYNDVEFFKCRKPDGIYETIHASRVTVVKGRLAPDNLDLDARRYYFGFSIVQMVEDALKSLGASITGMSNMLAESGISIFSMDGFVEMLSRPNGEAKIRERISLTKRCMSSMRAVFGDKNDTFQMLSHNFAGIPESLKILMMICSARSEIPVSILFGQTATGLSQTNEADVKAYEALVEKWRTKTLYRPMCSIISDFTRRNIGSKESSEFEFGSVSTMTQTERLNTLKIQTDIMKILFDMGVKIPDEIEKIMFKNGDASKFEVNT